MRGAGKEAEYNQKTFNPNNYKLLNGFDHPRSCVADIDVAAALLRYLIVKLINRRLMVRPIIVMHPLEKTEGGMTSFEKRGLIELAGSAGARKTFIWAGHTLTHNELIT